MADGLKRGDRVAVFGQGVIGLIATRLAVLSGAEVVAVDALPARLEHAVELGAAHTVDARVEEGILLSINAIATALRNSG